MSKGISIKGLNGKRLSNSMRHVLADPNVGEFVPRMRLRVGFRVALNMHVFLNRFG